MLTFPGFVQDVKRTLPNEEWQFVNCLAQDICFDMFYRAESSNYTVRFVNSSELDCYAFEVETSDGHEFVNVLLSDVMSEVYAWQESQKESKDVSYTLFDNLSDAVNAFMANSTDFNSMQIIHIMTDIRHHAVNNPEKYIEQYEKFLDNRLRGH